MSKAPVLPPSDLPFLFRARDLRDRDIPRWRVQSWLSHGHVTRVGRGLYRVVGAPETELETLAAVARTVPEGVFCLLTALTFLNCVKMDWQVSGRRYASEAESAVAPT